MPQVFVPAGEFRMGLAATESDRLFRACRSGCTETGRLTLQKSEPTRAETAAAFWIHQTEVTNQAYARCVTAGVCDPPERSDSATRSQYYASSEFGNYPVIWVNWSDADRYCAWAGGRLPARIEWEKAARGVDGRLFPWGDELPDSERANVDNLLGDTQPVGAYPAGASPYGVLDMAGNVWEWVADWYVVGQQRAGRGGSWGFDGVYATAALDDWWEPDKSGSGVGFRCVFDGD
jgi:serine/threonine-protein kinase